MAGSDSSISTIIYTDPRLLGLFGDTFDPEEIDGFELEYHAPETIKCSIPGCGTPHKFGYIGLIRGGLRVAIGNVCGQTFLGQGDFLKHQRELEARQKAERLRRRVTSPDFSPAKTIAAVEATGFGPVILTSRAHRTLRNLPGLFDDLPHACRKLNGWLYIEERVRDLAAEERRAGKSATGPIYSYRNTRVHLVQGEAFLADGERVLKLHSDAIGKLKAAARLLEKPALSDREVHQIADDAISVHRSLTFVYRVVLSYRDFLSSSNLMGIDSWSEKADRGHPKLDKMRSSHLKAPALWPDVESLRHLVVDVSSDLPARSSP